MKQMFQEENIRLINMNGEKHGTITPRINDKENFEVTTLRIDVVTDGRHAEVEFTKDWLLDANRRDLTINAMFLGLDGNVYDYFYGFEDLQKRIVRFVGDADERIKEDYLRILRYFRFYGKIATDPDVHDPEILQTITLNANGLSRISGERIWVELKKILQGNFASELCTKIIECELSQHIGLPEKPSLEKLHSLWSSRRNDKPYHYCTLFSSLLETPEDALRLHERLKFSAYERDLIYFIMNQNEKTADVEDLR
jgi:tRNA nucleotidyltransferase (CCA-adding enzyme)